MPRFIFETQDWKTPPREGGRANKTTVSLAIQGGPFERTGAQPAVTPIYMIGANGGAFGASCQQAHVEGPNHKKKSRATRVIHGRRTSTTPQRGRETQRPPQGRRRAPTRSETKQPTRHAAGAEYPQVSHCQNNETGHTAAYGRANQEAA